MSSVVNLFIIPFALLIINPFSINILIISTIISIIAHYTYNKIVGIVNEKAEIESRIEHVKDMMERQGIYTNISKLQDKQLLGPMI